MSEIPITNMRIDPELKAQANDVFRELGLNMSSAVNIFLRAVVRERGIPFDVRISDENQNDGKSE